MEIREEGGRVELACTLDEVKEIYRALFQVLRSQAGDAFDDGDLLMELQLFLQRKAREAGVDATVHVDWERFLGYDRPVPCEERYAGYLEGRGPHQAADSGS
ncbi:MAG: hypothetical protein ACE5IM_10260 [Nitrospinota bacterium]